MFGRVLGFQGSGLIVVVGWLKGSGPRVLNGFSLPLETRLEI